MTALHKLGAIDSDTGLIQAVIDTPKGSRAKYKYDPETGQFRVSKLLPLGAYFPYNFGFIPSTKGEDGDALDLLIIMDEPLAIGAVVPVELVGAIMAEQKEKGRSVRNDRLLGALKTEYNPAEIHSIDDIGKQRLAEIEHFFISYNQMHGREFKPLGLAGKDQAMQLLKAAL